MSSTWNSRLESTAQSRHALSVAKISSDLGINKMANFGSCHVSAIKLGMFGLIRFYYPSFDKTVHQRIVGRTEFLTATIASEPLVGYGKSQLERNGALLRVHATVSSKTA